MALLKTRPTIELLVPQSITVGRPFDAEVRLHAPEDVEVEHVQVDLSCTAGWVVGAGKSRVARDDELLRMRATPFAGPVLTQGDHAFRVRFEPAASLPPSYAETTASVRWAIDVEVSIPWWPDARSQHPLSVTQPDARMADSQPSRFRQATTSLGAPYIEASLTSSAIAPGGRIAGAIALFNFSELSALPIRVGLVERHTLYSRYGQERVRDGRSWTVRTESPVGAHQRGVPFEFLVPEDVTPSFRCPAFEHAFALEIEVKAGLLSRQTLSMPVLIANDSTLRNESMQLAVPSVGASRMEAIGRTVAEGRGYAIDGAALTRTIEASDVAVEIELRHETRSARGTFLVAALRYPRLGLGLVVEPQTGIAGYFTRDIEIGEKAWDAAHRVSARDAQQAIAFLNDVVPRLGAQEATFAAMNDDGARLDAPDPDLSSASLDAFAARAERVAMVLAGAMARVPLPTRVDAGGDWQPLRARLGARFVAGDLSLDDGQLGGTTVEVQTRWEDGPTHVFELVPDPPLPEEASMVLAAPRAEASTVPGLSPEVRALLARLPEDAAQLQLGAGRIRLELPFDRSSPKPRARREDVASVIDLLARLAPLFGVRRGPFR
jgi:hypothetical protein